MGYALRPFIDPASSTAVKMAYQEINLHRRSLSSSLEIAQQHNLKFNFVKTPEQARIQELMKQIHKLEDTARKKSSSRAEKSSPKVKECASRTKKVAMKVSSGRTARRTPPSPNSSSISDEEAAPLIPKGKHLAQRGRPQPPLVLVLKNLKHRGLHLLRQKVLSREDLPNLPPAYQKMLCTASQPPVLTKTTIYPLRDSKSHIPKGLILILKPLFKPQNQIHQL